MSTPTPPTNPPPTPAAQGTEDSKHPSAAGRRAASVPRSRKVLSYAAAVVLVVAVVSVVLWLSGKRSWIPRSVLAYHEVPGFLIANGGGYLLKNYREPSQGFLIRWVNSDQAIISPKEYWAHRGPRTDSLYKPPLDRHIWRFDPGVGTFVASSAREWQALIEQPPVLAGPLNSDPVTGKRRDSLPEFRDRWSVVGPWVEGQWDRLVHDGREFALPEPYLEEFVQSPGGAYLLILMRNGRIARTSWWGEGRSPTGYLYAVIYSTATGQPITPVYRVGNHGPSWGASWTLDSRYVLFDSMETDDNPPAKRLFVLPNPDLVNTKPKLR